MKKDICIILLMVIAVILGVGVRYYMQTGSFMPQNEPAEPVQMAEPQKEPSQETAVEEVASQVVDAEVEMQKPDNDWGVVLTAKDVTPDGMTLVCARSGGTPTGELSTGPWYEIEKKVSGKWQQAPAFAEVCWEDVAWIIPEGETIEWELNWTWIYDRLAPGEYRMVKEITDFRQTGDFDTCRSYAYFTIEE